MKKIPCSFLWLLFVLGILLPGRFAVSVEYDAPIPGENDRLGWSADGNRHDPDDWGATAMALAIFAKQGWQDKLVHIDYNNWLPDNTPYKSAEETISVVEGAKKFKFTQTKIFDNQTDLEAAIDNVVAEINKSSSSSRFWYVQAGPFEVAYLALLKADPDKRKYCILVSHSAANDRPQHWPGQHGKDDCVALGAKYFYTTGQGKEKFGGGRFHEWQLVDWMKNSPNPEYRWVYSRLKKTAEHKRGALDASDGGMAFALATGDIDGNFSPKLKDFLGTDWAEPTFGNPKADPLMMLLTTSEKFAAGWNTTVPEILTRIKAPTFPAKNFLITSYGAVGDGTTDCTKAFADAISACHDAGGGRVVVPAGGIYLTGAIHFKDNVNLHVQAKATIRFSTNPKDYLPLVYTRWEGHEHMNYSPLIYAWEKTNIAITGSGTLDGQASPTAWWPWKPRAKFGWKKGEPSQSDPENQPALYQMGEDDVPVEQRIFGEGHYLRPSFIQPYRSQNILIDGVTIVRSPFWIIHPVLSSNVTISNVRVESLGPNNDGCNPESCTDVLIENSYFDTGDDCISIKAGKNRDGRRVGVPASNYVIRNCTMKEGHGGIVMGSEVSGGINNIYAEDITFNSPNLGRVFRIKTNCLRGGIIENIFLRNSTVLRAQQGIKINYYYTAAKSEVSIFAQPGFVAPFAPVVRNIFIENVAFNNVDQAFDINAYESSPLENLVVKDCAFTGVKKADVLKGVKDIRLIRVTRNGKDISNQ